MPRPNFPALPLRILIASFLALSCAPSARAPGGPVQTPQSEAALARDADLWVDSVMAVLSLERKVGQMLMVRIEGTYTGTDHPELERARHYVERIGIGGFSIGLGTPTEVAVKTNALQRVSTLPLWFAADFEWGAGMRLWRPTFLPYTIEGEGGTGFPFNMGIGATGDVSNARRAGRVSAQEARAVGVHWLFAPVVDVNTAPDNPIVNVRSYGSDPSLVSRFAAAFIAGAREAGALTTAKHFPGHGGTREDSHVALPLLETTVAGWQTLELPPFRAAIQSGVDAVMLGHLAVPALTGGSDLPASVSPRVVTGLLREQLGFKGIIVTDALTMNALRVQPGYATGEFAVRVVEAGADVLLSPPDAERAHAAIVHAVRTGRLTPARIDSSVSRILHAKAKLRLHRARLVGVESVMRLVGNVNQREIARDVAQKSITLARDAAGLVPLDPRKVRSLAVIAFTAPNDLVAGRALAAELREIYGNVAFTRVDERASIAVFEDAVRHAAAADAIIFATFLMPISGQGHLRVPPAAEQLASRIAQLHRPTITVAFGDPYGPVRLATAGSYMLAWQPRGGVAQAAVARAIAGLAPIRGKLPVALEGSARYSGLTREPMRSVLSFATPAQVGMDARALARVDSIIDAGLAGGAAPGGAVAIGRHGRLVRLRGYGRLDRRPRFAAATDSSLYDLASLTKVVATTTAAMLLVDDGLLDLDAPVRRYLPEWRGSALKESVTIRNLLLHNSGLTAGRPLWRTVHNRDDALRAISALSLDYEPGTRTVYSDFGMILMALIIERLSGTTLDALLAERVFQPLGLRETMFNPLGQTMAAAATGKGMTCCTADAASRWFPRIAPTEVDILYRRQHMHGRVHDENAFALGGVAGHAGLFSSARDLAVFAQMLLNGGYYNGKRIIDPQTVKLFTTRADPRFSRALGWDTPDPAQSLNSSAGAYFSPASFGHTGFTGTSIWIDPEHDLFVILLTNRVNPTRENNRHVPLRIAVADAVQQAVKDQPVVKRR